MATDTGSRVGAHGGVGGDAEALGEASVRREGDVAAAENVAADEVLALVEAEEVVAQGIGDKAVQLIRRCRGEGYDETVQDGVSAATEGDGHAIGGGFPLEEDALHMHWCCAVLRWRR